MDGAIVKRTDKQITLHKNFIMGDRIKKKMIEELASMDLTIDDLTQEELEELKEEIIAKEKGFMILDGVLSNPAILYRRLRPKDL